MIAEPMIVIKPNTMDFGLIAGDLYEQERLSELAVVILEALLRNRESGIE